MRILVTGTAGFIGFHLARRLIADGHDVTGVDGLTPYYDVRLKAARHAILNALPGFAERILMLEDAEAFTAAADAARPEAIVHLAAQAGVRYSLDNPRAYVDANLLGSFNVLETARRIGVRHLMFASTSSVYGAGDVIPFVEGGDAEHPLTLYAATKRAGELMSHAYSHLWSIPTTALRFFTVYGPWGRPDMALFKFVDAMLEDRPIDVYGAGDAERDFTYVDDIVEALVRLLPVVPERGRPIGAGDTLSPVAPWRVVNIGRGAPASLDAFIAEIERALARKARRNPLPVQPGDARRTFAAGDLLEALTGYRPSTELAEGVAAFCTWRLGYRPQGEA